MTLSSFTDNEIDENIIMATDAIITATRRNTKLINVDHIQYIDLPHEINDILESKSKLAPSIKFPFYSTLI